MSCSAADDGNWACDDGNWANLSHGIREAKRQYSSFKFQVSSFYLSHTRLYRDCITSSENVNQVRSMDSANIVEYNNKQ